MTLACMTRQLSGCLSWFGISKDYTLYPWDNRWRCKMRRPQLNSKTERIMSKIFFISIKNNFSSWQLISLNSKHFPSLSHNSICEAIISYLSTYPIHVPSCSPLRCWKTLPNRSHWSAVCHWKLYQTGHNDLLCIVEGVLMVGRFALLQCLLWHVLYLVALITKPDSRHNWFVLQGKRKKSNLKNITVHQFQFFILKHMILIWFSSIMCSISSSQYCSCLRYCCMICITVSILYLEEKRAYAI